MIMARALQLKFAIKKISMTLNYVFNLIVQKCQDLQLVGAQKIEDDCQ